jgi:hypothetical protein
MMNLNDPYVHLVLHRQRSQELITKSEQDRIVKHLRGRRRLRTRTPGDGRWTKAQRLLARVLLPIAGSTPHRR